jgi:hypothetical protein
MHASTRATLVEVVASPTGEITDVRVYPYRPNNDEGYEGMLARMKTKSPVCSQIQDWIGTPNKRIAVASAGS